MLKLLGCSELRSAIRQYEQATAHEIQVLSRTVADQMELEAKLKAPWTDRTGNARRTLQGFAGLIDENIYIGVAGNMLYSPELEFGHREKYAILRRVASRYAVNIVGRLAELIYEMNIDTEAD